MAVAEVLSSMQRDWTAVRASADLNCTTFDQKSLHPRPLIEYRADCERIRTARGATTIWMLYVAGQARWGCPVTHWGGGGHGAEKSIGARPQRRPIASCCG